MRIDINTTTPIALRNAIYDAVENNTLESYEKRLTGDDEDRLTPVGVQFKDIVTLRIERVPNQNILRVTFRHWNSIPQPTYALRAIVLGMFTSALVTHFNTQFTNLEIYS